MSEGTMPVRCVTKGFFPLDEQLGLKDQRWSEGWRSRRCAEWAGNLRTSGGDPTGHWEVEISASSVWAVDPEMGRAVGSLGSQRTARANATPDGKEIIAGEVQHKRRMGLSWMDDDLHSGEEWKELKMGVSLTLSCARFWTEDQ